MHYTSKEVYEHISKQTNDPIVERKTCRVSGKEFAVYQSDLDFYKKISPTFDGKVFSIPVPTLCPEERARRRLSFRNERNLYRRKCDATQKDIISIYSQHKSVIVYNQASRWSDSWSPFSYARGFDSTRTFAQQYGELSQSAPHMSLINDYQSQENSHYINLAGPSKDCYLIFETNNCEKCLYSYKIFESDYCIDCSHVSACQYCYECIDIKKCMMAKYCYHCIQCSYVEYCVNCRNLDHCFGCANLNGGTYMIFNKQYSKEEYGMYVTKLKETYSPDEIREMVEKHAFHKAISSLNNEGYVSGNHIQDSKNVQFSYDIINGENCKYCDLSFDLQDCYDYSAWGENSSRLYEVQNSGNNCSSMFFTNFSWEGNTNIWYSQFCIGNNKHLFGCHGLRNAEYCIFNKQYTAHEYEKEVAKIVYHMQETGERGEFFDPQMSVFGYNETLAAEYFPLSKEEAIHQGFKRFENGSDTSVPSNASLVKPEDYTKEARDLLKKDDAICHTIVVCMSSGRPFRILKQELEFYKKHDLPLPKYHPDVRHMTRSKKRPGRGLKQRICDKTEKEIITVYAQTSKKKVYDNEAYESAMYS